LARAVAVLVTLVTEVRGEIRPDAAAALVRRTVPLNAATQTSRSSMGDASA
jgi:hypothetical protein